MSITVKEIKENAEQFFADAFCAKRATLIEDAVEFKLVGVMEIETGDKRGTVYVGIVEKTKGDKPYEQR